MKTKDMLFRKLMIKQGLSLILKSKILKIMLIIISQLNQKTSNYFLQYCIIILYFIFIFIHEPQRCKLKFFDVKQHKINNNKFIFNCQNLNSKTSRQISLTKSDQNQELFDLFEHSAFYKTVVLLEKLENNNKDKIYYIWLEENELKKRLKERELESENFQQQKQKQQYQEQQKTLPSFVQRLEEEEEKRQKRQNELQQQIQYDEQQQQQSSQQQQQQLQQQQQNQQQNQQQQSSQQQQEQQQNQQQLQQQQQNQQQQSSQQQQQQLQQQQQNQQQQQPQQQLEQQQQQNLQQEFQELTLKEQQQLSELKQLQYEQFKPSEEQQFNQEIKKIQQQQTQDFEILFDFEIDKQEELRKELRFHQNRTRQIKEELKMLDKGSKIIEKAEKKYKKNIQQCDTNNNKNLQDEYWPINEILKRKVQKGIVYYLISWRETWFKASDMPPGFEQRLKDLENDPENEMLNIQLTRKELENIKQIKGVIDKNYEREIKLWDKYFDLVTFFKNKMKLYIYFIPKIYDQGKMKKLINLDLVYEEILYPNSYTLIIKPYDLTQLVQIQTKLNTFNLTYGYQQEDFKKLKQFRDEKDHFFIYVTRGLKYCIYYLQKIFRNTLMRNDRQMFDDGLYVDSGIAAKNIQRLIDEFKFLTFIEDK